MRSLVLGGARSGKSTHAEALALAWPGRVDYVATSFSDPDDAEWQERIALHRARRPDSWTTIETTDLVQVLDQPDDGSLVLVDCLAVWITRMMDDCGIWSENHEGVGATDSSASAPEGAAPPPPLADPALDGRTPRECLQQQVDRLVAAVERTRREVVFVSNEVGLSVVPEHWSGRFFRDQLGILNMRVAAACESVTLVVAGIPVAVKTVASAPVASAPVASAPVASPLDSTATDSTAMSTPARTVRATVRGARA